MTDNIEAALLGSIVGAVLGMLGAYVFDLRKLAIERSHAENDRIADEKRARAAVATALLLEMRNLELNLRRFRKRKKPGTWKGTLPVRVYPLLIERITRLSPEAQYAVSDFYGLAQDTAFMLEEAQKVIEPSDYLHYLIRLKAAGALKALTRAKPALDAEGGSLPPSVEVGVYRFPTLPEMPERQFHVPFTDPTYPDEEEE